MECYLDRAGQGLKKGFKIKKPEMIFFELFEKERGYS